MMMKPSPAQSGSDGPALAAALAAHRAAILHQISQTWRVRAPKNTVMLGDPQSAMETAESISTVWFTWLENISDLNSVRDLAINLVRQGMTYTMASALAQALGAIVTELTANDAQHEVTALKLTRHFSAAFLDQIATQHELQTQQEQEHLAVQLKASAEVGRAAASILDTDQLLREVVNLITDRFGFYYTAVFTLDHTGQYAVLREATGQAGEVLKNLNHKLDIHGQSMVGAVITLRRPRVAAEVGRDVPRFSNPLLPDTQSEIALPLSVGDRVLGALDVQSTEPRAFDETAVTVLQNMADQIAIALENARLFERAQANLRDSQTAQANLARNQAQLADALKIANLSYWEYDIATDTFHFDEQAFVMLHTTPQQLGSYTLTGREFVQRFVHPDDRRQSLQLFRRASHASDPQHTAQAEVRVYDVDGQLHWIVIRLRVVQDESGRANSLIGTNQDITERKRAEAILSQSEAQLSDALRIAQLGYWEYDVARDIFLFNDQFYTLFNTTAEAEGGYEMPSARYAQKFVHPDDAAIVGGEIGAALQSTDPNYSRQIDHRMLYADGSLGYLTVRFRVERDADGRPIKFIGANEDITERKLAEATLQRERGLLRGVIDSVPDLIFYKDLNGRYLGCNVAFEAFAGRSERELIGQTDHNLFPLDIAEFFREQDAHMLQQRTSRRNEEWVTYSDGRRVLLDTLKTPFYDEAGQVLGLIGISRDITARKQADSERDRLLARSETLYHTSADLNAAHTYREVLEVLREHTALGDADRNVSLNLFDQPWVNDEVPEWSITLDRWTTLPAEAVLDRYPLHNFPAIELLRADGPTIITDISTDGRLDEATRQMYAVRFQGGSTLFVPLVASGQWIGFLNAVYSEPRAFSEEEIRVITSAIVQAGVVIQSIQRLAEVAASEARFRDVALASADWVWEVNAQGTYTYCSDRVIDVLGYRPDEVIGKTPFDFMVAGEADRVGPVFAQAIAAQQPLRDLENRNRTKDGREIILLTSGVPMLGEMGELLGYRGVDEDITQRRRTELDLAQERNILRTLIDNLPDFVFVKDVNSHFVVNNVAHAGLFGSTPEAIRGKSDFDFFPPELAERYFADEQAIIYGGQPVVDMEEPSVDATGRPRWHLATKMPMRDENGQPIGLVGVVRDITILKESEAERERLLVEQQKRAVQLQTAAEVSRASSSILQLDELLTTVVELVRDRFNLYYVGAFLLDDDGQWAVLRAGTGEAGRLQLAARHQLPLDETSMIGWTIIHQQARIALDVGQEAVRFSNPLLPNTRSEMALPLISRGHILGAATIQSMQPAAFTAEDVTVLQTMADQITTAAENARLFEQTQHSVQQMSALNNITTAISREIELVPILEAAYHSLQYLMSVDAFIVALYDAATNTVEYPLIYDEGQRYAEPAKPLSPNSRVGQVIHSGEPVVDHVSREDWQAGPTVANPVGNVNKPSASLLYMPLKRGAETIGVLSVQSYQFNAYTREHVDLLNSVANQLAIAILNARLFEQTRRAVDELNALNRRLTGEAWHSYVQTRSSEAVIWHANDPALTQLGQDQAEQLATGKVAVQQPADETDISVPIALRGQVIGALRFRAPADKWTAEAQAIATSIASHLAQAAENTRLIEQTQLTAQRDRAIAAAAERIRRSTEINAILQSAVEEINRYTVTDGISLQIGFEAAAPNGARPKEQVEL